MVRVTAAIISDAGKVFIAKRKSTARLADLWEFPGGKIEPGETLRQCLCRELREEFEVDARVGAKIGTNIHRYDFGTIELTAFRVELLSARLVLKDHAEMRWVLPDDLDGYAFAPADLPFVQMLKKGEIDL